MIWPFLIPSPITMLRASLAAAIVGGCVWVGMEIYRAGQEDIQAKWDKAQAERIEAQLAARRKVLEDEDRTKREQNEAVNEATRQTNKLIGERAAADRASQRLLHQYKTASRGDGPACPADTGVRESTESTGDLRDRVLARIDAVATDLGQYADQLRIARDTCERSYQALTPTHKE